jgi:hypothetical protein
VIQVKIIEWESKLFTFLRFLRIAKALMALLLLLWDSLQGLKMIQWIDKQLDLSLLTNFQVEYHFYKLEVSF